MRLSFCLSVFDFFSFLFHSFFSDFMSTPVRPLHFFLLLFLICVSLRLCPTFQEGSGCRSPRPKVGSGTTSVYGSGDRDRLDLLGEPLRAENALDEVQEPQPQHQLPFHSEVPGFDHHELPARVREPEDRRAHTDQCQVHETQQKQRRIAIPPLCLGHPLEGLGGGYGLGVSGVGDGL